MAGELGYDPTTGQLVYSPATGQLALDCGGGAFPPAHDCVGCGNCCYSNLSAILLTKPVLTYTGADPLLAHIINTYNNMDSTNIPYVTDGGGQGNVIFNFSVENTYQGQLYNVGTMVTRDCSNDTWNIVGMYSLYLWDDPIGWYWWSAGIFYGYLFAIHTCCDFGGESTLTVGLADTTASGYVEGTVVKNACCALVGWPPCEETPIYWCELHTDGQCEAPPP